MSILLRIPCISFLRHDLWWWAGELVACASGANFTPHIINVAAGEVSIIYVLCLIKALYLIAWCAVYICFLIDALNSWISILENSDIFLLTRHFILISSVFLPTFLFYLLGCQYEGHIFLPTRSKGNLHSICQWCYCKCYTASTGLIRWHSYLWGLSILTSEVIYIC